MFIQEKFGLSVAWLARPPGVLLYIPALTPSVVLAKSLDLSANQFNICEMEIIIFTYFTGG